MTRPEVRELRDALQARLDALSESIGFKLTLGNASFSEDAVTFKLAAGRLRPDGSAASPEAAAFVRSAVFYGLAPADLGRTFSHGRRSYTVTGAAPRSRKAPVLATRDDGKVFKFPAATVRAALAV